MKNENKKNKKKKSNKIFSYFFLFLYTKDNKSFFFFFQAEDGIRDVAVTGVQTCALPISDQELRRRPAARRPGQSVRPRHIRAGQRAAGPGSEERRVGKECRSRWSPY